MGLQLTSWRPVALDDGISIINTFSREVGQADEIVGNIGISVTGVPLDKRDSQRMVSRDVILRSKMDGKNMLSKYASAIEEKTSKEYADEILIALEVLHGSRLRDVLVAQAATADPVLQAIMPRVYHVEIDVEKDIMFFVMEKFDNDSCSHIECIEGGKTYGIDVWTRADIQKALAGIASMHGKYLGRMDLLPRGLVENLVDDSKILLRANTFMKLSVSLREKHYEGAWSHNTSRLLYKIVGNMENIIGKIDQYPKTLTHGDFCSRNACLRRRPELPQSPLCLYDWEVAGMNVPQRDVAFFLAHCVPKEGAVGALNEHAEYYRQCLSRELLSNGHDAVTVEKATDPASFMEIFDYMMMQFMVFYLPIGYVLTVAAGAHNPALHTQEAMVSSYIENIAHQYDFLQ